MKNKIRKIFYGLPVNIRYAIRRIIYFPIDIIKKEDDLTPPKGMIFTGGGNYKKVGDQFFDYFLRFGDINPDSKILDIGSGIGRMAVPFTKFLSSEGKYEGFDIVKSGVDWCNNHIKKKYPNFNFKHIPLKNDLYNLSTDEKAADFVFPYENDSFDFIFLTSVFTHMLPDDVENYLKEINRVLKKGKSCFVTFFILDEKSKSKMKNEGMKNFPFDLGNYSLMDKSVKEANVAYSKVFINDLLKDKGFEITRFIRGNWSGLSAGELNEHQDILIVKKL